MHSFHSLTHSFYSLIHSLVDRSNQEFSGLWRIHPLRLLLYTVIILTGLGGVFYYTRLIGMNFPGSWLLWSGALIVGVIGLELLVRWPVLGLAGLLLAAYFVNWFMPTGTDVSIDITIHVIAIILGVWALRTILIKRHTGAARTGAARTRFLPLSLTLPVLAFIAVATLALILGNERFGKAAAGGASLPAQFGGWVLLVFPLLLLLASANLAHSLRSIKALFSLFLLCGVFLTGEILLLRLGVIETMLFPPRAASSIFWTLMVALPVGQALFNSGADRPSRASNRWRAIYLLIALLALAGALQLTDKLANWLPLLAALLILLWLWNWRWGLAFTIIGFLCALPVILWLAYTPATIAIYDWRLPWPYSAIINIDSEFSIRSRLATWPVMFQLVRQNPLLGLGPANYHFFTNQFRIWEYFLLFNSHNNYWDVAAQTGLIGLGLFAWIAWQIIRQARRLYRRAHDGFTRGFAAGALAGFCGVLVAGAMNDYFMPYVYNVGFGGFPPAVFIWLFVGCLAGLEWINN